MIAAELLRGHHAVCTLESMCAAIGAWPGGKYLPEGCRQVLTCKVVKGKRRVTVIIAWPVHPASPVVRKEVYKLYPTGANQTPPPPIDHQTQLIISTRPPVQGLLCLIYCYRKYRPKSTTPPQPTRVCTASIAVASSCSSVCAFFPPCTLLPFHNIRQHKTVRR